MLSKDLLRFRRIGGKIKPQYVKVKDKNIHNLCNDFLSTIHKCQGLNKKELNNELQIIIHGYKNLKLSKGLLRTINSECRYHNADNFDFFTERQKIFTTANKALNNTVTLTIDQYRNSVIDKLTTQQHELLTSGLFSDHPDYEILISISENLTPEYISNKYNSWLLQSLLIYTNRLKIELSSPNTALLRKFIGKLRFHRLLCECKVINNGTYKLIIDGPLNILENSQKYGLQLAIIFPYIYQFKKWQLESQLKIDDKEFILTADDQLSLQPIYKHQNDYIPEEIKLFGKVFQEKEKDWMIKLNNDVITVDAEQIVFPDFSFIKKEQEDSKNVTIKLELFHRWHSRVLEKRLDAFISNKLPANLIFGIDRAIIKNNEELQKKVENLENSKSYFFFYRDFPTLTAVKRILKKH